MRKGARQPRPSPNKASGNSAAAVDAVDVRALCHRLLTRVQGGARLGPILSATWERLPLSTTDKAFVTELSNGTLRHETALDAALDEHLARPVRSLPPPVRVALRMGAYQLLYMRVPAHAAVDTTVRLVSKRFGQLRAVTNAVLRAMSQSELGTDAARLSTSDGALGSALSDETLASYATRLSQPVWLINKLRAQCGDEEALKCCIANNERPALHVRINTARITREAWMERCKAHATSRLRMSAHPLVASAVVIEQSGPVSQLYGYEEGLFCVQDAAAQMVGLLAAAQQGAQVLDACAAPGGKTTHLLQDVGRTGHVLAVDVHEGRLRRVERNAARMQLGAQLRLRCVDLTEPASISAIKEQAPHGFDCVVLDAPCSGMGTLRRHPELRTRSEAHLPALYALQAELLDAVGSLVKPGGRLVYAVCSPLSEEGEMQARSFLARAPQFSIEPLPATLTTLGTNDMLSSWPHRHAMDGHFACRFMKAPSAP